MKHQAKAIFNFKSNPQYFIGVSGRHDNRHNDTQHNDTIHNNKNTTLDIDCTNHYNTVLSSVVMLSVAFIYDAQCHSAEFHYAECRGAII